MGESPIAAAFQLVQNGNTTMAAATIALAKFPIRMSSWTNDSTAAAFPHLSSNAKLASASAAGKYLSRSNTGRRNGRGSLESKLGFISAAGEPNRRLGIAVAANGGREGLTSEGILYPEAEFYKVEAIVRPWRLSQVATALMESGIRGVTVTDVRGFGSQGVSRERHAGSEFSEDSFVTKVKLEVVVSKDQVEVVISKIVDEAWTGEIGDGKIFVLPVSDVIRVRTGERGILGERMAGGRADQLSAKIAQLDVY